MVVYAEKIVEEPTIEITTDTKVGGQATAPPPPAEPAPAPAKAASRVPLIVGLLLVAGILVIWMLRRRKPGEPRD